MKRFRNAAIAAISLLSPLALASPAAADPPHHFHGRGHYGHGHGHNHHNGHYRGHWDHRHHNGYYYRNVWHYGPPPAHHPHVHYGYRTWRRGDHLPPYYRTRYVVVHDYHRYRLAPPPHGYHYVQDDHGAYLLVGITTGLILGAILAQ